MRKKIGKKDTVRRTRFRQLLAREDSRMRAEKEMQGENIMGQKTSEGPVKELQG